NDDGSGTISILSIARRMKQTGITFRSDDELVALAATNRMHWDERHTLVCFIEIWMVRISRMVQVDILAYHAPDECPQVG
ncbi:hypothetical protein EDC04DRAFT_2583927, partial [Pisolithus marmoratus]